jgi:hypothetical protein
LFGSLFALHDSEQVVGVRFDLGRAGGAITVSLLPTAPRAVLSRAPCWAEYGAADAARRADILEQRRLPGFVLTLVTRDPALVTPIKKVLGAATKAAAKPLMHALSPEWPSAVFAPVLAHFVTLR